MGVQQWYSHVLHFLALPSSSCLIDLYFFFTFLFFFINMAGISHRDEVDTTTVAPFVQVRKFNAFIFTKTLHAQIKLTYPLTQLKHTQSCLEYSLMIIKLKK